MKKTIWLLIGLLAALLTVIAYTRLGESQKRYLGYLARQLPYLPARYMV